MLNTNKQIKKVVFIALFALFTMPNLASADTSYGFDTGGYDTGGWGAWGGGSSAYDYTPTYSSQPTYSDYYNEPSYGGGYSSPSYGYTPSYNGSSFGGYSLPSYTSSSIPSSNYNDNYNKNTSTNTNTIKNTSSSTSSSSATAINNNVNNVYVYTNPTGNAVVTNPGRIPLSGYCAITPQNARLGQTVVATAYASGGIGNYTYSWGGDIYSATGASTSFTSYTSGTKTIIVTIRSDQEIITKSCSVTFDNNYVQPPVYTPTYPQYQYNSSSVNLTPNITSGTPVSGVYLSQLPATGLSLTFVDYMIALMVVVLAAVFTFIYQARKRLIEENI